MKVAFSGTSVATDWNPEAPRYEEALAEKDPLCLYIDTTGAETLVPRHIHFTAAGTLGVGQRFAAALADLEKQ